MKNMKKLWAISCSLMALSSTALAISVPDPGNAGWGSMTQPVQTALGLVQIVGVAIAVVMVMYVGIKYLTSGAGKKAEAKETMVPVLIGAALLALAPTVIRWIIGAFTSTSGT